ncbi:hypothetical protein LXA43DRAFT_895699 [Ganoderma leucocontextum]|nr:hypothetical protein LXA43DRAFT_895699 [Ganoderma leucocontextum]
MAKLTKAWCSPAYNHFKFPVVIMGEDGAVYHYFICKDHSSLYLDQIAHEDSMSNLLHHVHTCDLPEIPEVEAITAFTSGAMYSRAKFQYLFTLWCAHRHCPFSVVEDPEFWQIVQMLYACAETPSRISILYDIQHLLKHAHMQLIIWLIHLSCHYSSLVSHLQELPRKIHLCVDGWTSPNFMSFLGVTVP